MAVDWTSDSSQYCCGEEGPWPEVTIVLNNSFLQIPIATEIKNRIKTTKQMSLMTDDIHPVKPHSLMMLDNQSPVSSFISCTRSLILLIKVWILWLLSVMLKQHSPSNSWHPCPCATNKKSLAAQFAFLVAFSSSRLLIAVDVKLACFTTQHSRCTNSPSPFAAPTHGKI